MLTFTEQIDNILNQATTSYDQNYGNDHNIVTSPWDVESLYEFQYFNCPTCPYKHKSAQDFVDHAINTHQESKNHFMNISNHDSFSDIWPPWKYGSMDNFINHLKNELNENEVIICEGPVEKSNLIDDPLGTNGQVLTKSEEDFNNLNASSKDTLNVNESNTDTKIQSTKICITSSENKMITGKGILYNNNSDKLEFLDEITPKGRKLLICQAHLLHQGKSADSKYFTIKTAKWLEANVKMQGTSTKNVMKILRHYKFDETDGGVSPIIKQFGNSCGRLDSLDQLTAGKEQTCLFLNFKKY